ncbi:MAG: polyprenyl synthetase family protein, partial [Saprospiraceae bacterium]
MKSPAALKQIFDDYIATNEFKQAPVALYEPINYIFSLGGKRLRPLLLLMGYNLFGERVEEALPAAFAIEIFHNFSLLHDDIMDEAPLRRGKPSVHVKYNVNTGILSGDVMLIYAYQYLARLSVLPRYAKIVELFNQLAIDVCEGQQYDMNFEEEEQVALSAYLKMIELKTAALIGGALGMGAVIGGASEKDMEQLMQFGRNIGIAFQIQDDILDTFGDPEKFGKKV